MTFKRFALYFSGLILICLLGAGLYLHQNLSSLVERKAGLYLAEYGVQDLEIDRLRLASRKLAVAALGIRGERDGLAFEAILGPLEISYSWRMLFNDDLPSLILDQVDVSIERIAPGTASTSDPLLIENLLPHSFIAQLPMDSIEVKQWRLNYRSPEMPALSAVGKLLLTDQLNLQLTARHLGGQITGRIWTGNEESPLGAEIVLGDGENSVMELRAQLERATINEWQWTIQGELQYASALAWLQRLRLETELPLDISALDGLTLRGHSEFQAEIRHPDELGVSSITGRSALEQFNAAVSTEINIAQLDFSPFVAGIAGDVDVSIDFDVGGMALTIGPTELAGTISTEHLALPEDARRWLLWEEMIPIRWSNPEDILLTSDGKQVGSLQLRDALLVIGGKDSVLACEALNVNADFQSGKPARLKSTLNARLNSRLRKKQLPKMNLAFRHQGSAESSEFSLELEDTAESMSVDLLGKLNLDTGQGTYSLAAGSQDLPYAAGTVLPLLQKLKLLHKDVEIAGGSVSVASELRSETFDIATWQQRSQLVLDKVSGNFDGYPFEGMKVDAAWSGIERWTSLRPVEFSLARLNAGFDVLDLQALVTLPKPTPIAQPVVRIEKFSAGLFSGRIYLPEAGLWDFGAQTNKLTLRAQDWQLADIVSLQQDQDLQAQGVLEGELPISVTAGRIIIDGGYLRATPSGGSIRYIANEASQALAASSSELGLALDLLSDFNYQVLSSEVKLDQEGNLLLGLSLTGRNPEYYEGRQIQFNINVEQNLDPLLQSLRLSDKLVEQLEGGLR